MKNTGKSKSKRILANPLRWAKSKLSLYVTIHRVRKHSPQNGRPSNSTEHIENQIQLIRKSRQLHPIWYFNQYPEAQESGLDAASHYFHKGAGLGYNPGKSFDTRFYLHAYPEVASGELNPLVHFITRGQKEGKKPKSFNTRAVKDAQNRINHIKQKLLDLGFDEAPRKDLAHMAEDSECPHARSLAALELALWEMRSGEYRKAIELLTNTPGYTLPKTVRSIIVTAEILCAYALEDLAAGEETFTRATRDSLVSPNVLLAYSNLHRDEQKRLSIINEALAVSGIAPVSLLAAPGASLYDRLTVQNSLPPVTDGPKISVLLAAYNAEKTLPTALRSLQEQTWKNLEIFVLDDQSTDQTVAVAEGFAADDPRVRVIRMETNGGAYVARNRGLDLSTGDFVTIHDADDWSHPSKIETQIRYLISNPSVIGCTSQQARASSDLNFTRWTGQCHFIISNISSFLFRKAAIKEHFGYWDTARIAADNELIRRIKEMFGREAAVDLVTGPLSFQRDSGTSVVADHALGINGFRFGARKEYFDAQRHYHASGKSFKYTGNPGARPFPIPRLIQKGKPDEKPEHINVIIASEFRMDGGSVLSCIQEIRAAKECGATVGLLQLYRYDMGANTRSDMLPVIRREVNGVSTTVINYGESFTCDLLVIRYPPVLQERQRYLPNIDAKRIVVVVNQPPMSDYSETGVLRYSLQRCEGNLLHYFNGKAEWHPNGPMVRNVLHKRHAHELQHICLAPEDWHNIIHLPDWQRPLREVDNNRKVLRIGRHSRDSSVKWPWKKEDILAAYPEEENLEVHILGGASVPTQIVGHTPKNWRIHAFNHISPKAFLTGLDVFIFFAHPDWVESFPRTVLEAMAVGVPVILPESHRPLFGDRAIYATPQTAVATAKSLCADIDAYNEQVRKAWHYLHEHYSYEMHAYRLRDFGVTNRKLPERSEQSFAASITSPLRQRKGPTEFSREEAVSLIKSNGIGTAFERYGAEFELFNANARKISDFFGTYCANRLKDPVSGKENKRVFGELIRRLHARHFRENYWRTGEALECSRLHSFREEMTKRTSLRRSGAGVPEWRICSKTRASKFAAEFGVQCPRILRDNFSADELTEIDAGVIKPKAVGGSNGVYIKFGKRVYDVKHHVFFKYSVRDLKRRMKMLVENRKVDADQWYIEEYIQESEALSFLMPHDLKFYCFYGHIETVLEVRRYPELGFCWWDEHGNSISTGKYENLLFPGRGFSTSDLAVVRALSLGIPAPFVRIDFLSTGKQMVFGEITPSPGDYDKFSEEFDARLGREFIHAAHRLNVDLLKGKKFNEYKKIARKS